MPPSPDATGRCTISSLALLTSCGHVHRHAPEILEHADGKRRGRGPIWRHRQVASCQDLSDALDSPRALGVLRRHAQKKLQPALLTSCGHLHRNALTHVLTRLEDLRRGGSKQYLHVYTHVLDAPSAMPGGTQDGTIDLKGRLLDLPSGATHIIEHGHGKPLVFIPGILG